MFENWNTNTKSTKRCRIAVFSDSTAVIVSTRCNSLNYSNPTAGHPTERSKTSWVNKCATDTTACLMEQHRLGALKIWKVKNLEKSLGATFRNITDQYS